MFFGGWLYPAAPTLGVAAGVEITFDRDEFSCAAIGADAAQAISVPTKRQFNVFRIGIRSLRFKSRAKSDKEDNPRV
jgi:hypothetical protein